MDRYENPINIGDLDKAEVLASLYNHSRQQGMGFLNALGKKNLTVEDARKILESHAKDGGGAYFDYLQGRVMKVDLGGDSFDPRLYDRDNGQGAARAAIEELRRG